PPPRRVRARPYWPCLIPGSAQSSSIACVGFAPGLFACGAYLNSGRIVRPNVDASIIAVAVYQANPAEKTSTQPATVAQPCEPYRKAPARIPDPAASVESTENNPMLSASEAIAPDAVINARAKNQ